MEAGVVGAGAGVEVSGAEVSGAEVSGAETSGAEVSGSVGPDVDGSAERGAPTIDDGGGVREPVEQATSMDSARTIPACANRRRLGRAARRE